MRRALIAGFLLLTAATISTVNAAPLWMISAKRPCTGLTAGFARPMADLSSLVGPHWQPAPGPVEGQGLVLLFFASCPGSSYAGKATGAFTAAFVLVPVLQLESAGKQTHAIAVLQAAGKAGSPVTKFFRTHGIPVSAARVSLRVRKADRGKQAGASIRFTRSMLALDAQMLPGTVRYKSANTVAVRATPAGVLFSGPESSVRYAKGTATVHAVGTTWLERYQLGKPLFVTLDTDFVWNFTFAEAPKG